MTMCRIGSLAAIVASLAAIPFMAAWAEERSTPEKAPSPAQADLGPLIHEADLNVPVEKVWWVFSTDEGYRKLGVAQAKIDFRVGGKMLTHYKPDGVIGDEGTIENTILAFEPPRMLAFRITKPPQGFPFMQAYNETWSVVTLTDLGNGRTHLRLAGMGFTADPESQRMRAFFDQGNAWVLAELKKGLEGEATNEEAAGSAGSVQPGDSSTGSPSTDPLAPIRKEATISAPVHEVWQCWTTSAGMKSFLADASVELRVGGPFEIYFDSQAAEGQRGSEGCNILSYEPEKMLSFSWNAPPKFGSLREKRTWLVLHLEPHGGHATRVTLVHLGFAEQAAADPDNREGWSEVRAYFDNAWPMVLGALQDHFAPPGERR